jgi:hypothetical protein
MGKRHAYIGQMKSMTPHGVTGLERVNIHVILFVTIYGGDSNENFKSAIKIQNTALLSCKLTIMILMV